MTEEEIEEIFTPVAVCPICHKQLTIRELHPTYKQNWLLRHELFRKLVYKCKYCGCELKEQDFIREQEKEVEKMGIKNLTEAEEKEFYRLVGKMNGKETDKEQGVKVRKPRQLEEYFCISNDGAVIQSRWTNGSLDEARWELGNVFFTEESAWLAREKKKVEVELERYAKEHNGTAFNNRCYLIRCEEDEKRLICDTWATAKIQGTVRFTSRDVLVDAIEAVGKDRILKYIFNVDCEERE